MVQNFRSVSHLSESGLTPVDSDIWTIEAKQYLYFRPPIQPRYPYPHRAVVIRLNDNSLFVISPIKLTPDIRTDIDRLGTVKYLVSPNHLHHLHLGDWSQAYPNAKLYASPRLPSKRQDLNFYKTLSTDTPEPEWTGQIDQCIFGSGNGWVDEVVFFHRKSRTIILTDLVMDFNPETFSPIARLTTRWNQMYQHTPRGIQLAHIFDRTFLYNAIETVRGWEAEHVIIAHSPWLCVDGKQEVVDFLDSAFDWLTPRPPLIEGTTAIARLLIILLIILPVHAVVVLTADIIYPKLSRRDNRQSGS